jgi:hypothetical protein
MNSNESKSIIPMNYRIAVLEKGVRHSMQLAESFESSGLVFWLTRATKLRPHRRIESLHLLFEIIGAYMLENSLQAFPINTKGNKISQLYS